MIVSSITTAIINLIVFSLIPFIWWFCRYRKKEKFIKWIGIYVPHLKSKWWVLLIFAVLYYFFYNFDFTRLVDASTLEYLENSESVSSNAFAGLGIAAILQAVLFGLMHNVLYLLAGLDVGLWYHTLSFVFTGTGALLLGWLNEKIFNGSILPSILLHGAGNFITTMLVAFA